MRIAAAMSGGVDSSVTAALLAAQGHDVIGLTMRLVDEDPGPPGARGCCGIRAIDDARRVCARLGIPHYPLDFRAALAREVVADFCAEYARGRTPNPCIRCNDILKFKLLLGRLAELDAERLATGHYARVVAGGAGFELRRARDRSRDQSYFLYRFTQEQLARVLLPLGEMTKDEVRARARELGLSVADKPDSQEICFVPGDDYAAFLEARCPAAFVPGPVEDTAGVALGTHRGIGHFTVGQRRGVGIPFGERRYVTAIDAARNAVVVGSADEVRAHAAELEDVHWVAGSAPESAVRALVRLRNVHRGGMALVTPTPGERAGLVFDEPQWAVAPGQAAVFYEDDIVLGGGIIAASRPGD